MSTGRPLRVPFALAGVGLMLCAGALGQAGAPTEHAVTVVSTVLDVQATVDTRTMQFVAPCNSPGSIEPSADGRSFTFTEPSTTATACGELRTVVEVRPVQDTELVLQLAFLADRSVEGTTPAQPPLLPPATAAQQARLLFLDQERRDPYFAVDAGSQPATPIARTYLVPAGAPNITLVWFFQDNGNLGPDAQVDPGSLDFSATVSNITVRLGPLRITDSTVEQAQGEQVDRASGTGRATFFVNVTLPPLPEGQHAALTIETRRGPVLAQVDTPAGPLNGTTVPAQRRDDSVFWTIPANQTAQAGSGTYSFVFTSTRSLPPPPPPAAPQRLEPFYYTMLVLPAPAAVLAVYSGIVYRREAEGRYRRPSAGILALIAIALAYYLLLLGYSIFGAGVDVMATLPLAAEATLVYVQLLVLLLFFLVAAVVVGRYLAGAMRRDIEARRIQEDKLRRSNEELERFAYVASHDLQEPLRKVAGFTSLLQRRYKGRLDKDADEMIQYAVDGATRMQALIRDILAYSRVGSGELNIAPVETGNLMALVVADLGERIREDDGRVSWGDLPTVQADATQLRQVLQNLVENGLKYRHPGRRPRVRVAATREGVGWHFTVSDNGQGIPADKQAEIFGIFRRLHGQDVPGTGIGLALVKKALERHGGKVWVESKVGRGSTFHFTLPDAVPQPPRWAPMDAATEGLSAAPGTRTPSP